MYDDIAHGTRCKFETNRPRAVLFEGPPGLHSSSEQDSQTYLLTYVTYGFYLSQKN